MNKKPVFITLTMDLQRQALNMPDGTCVRLVDDDGIYWSQGKVGTNWCGERVMVRCDDWGTTY